MSGGAALFTASTTIYPPDDMATGSCRNTAWIAKHVMGLGFETCSRDCRAAAVTDALLALHALFTVVRHKAKGLRGGSLGAVALAWPAVNVVWSGSGVLMWLQPGGARPSGFESVWRSNAQLQAALVAVIWLTVRALHEASGRLSARGLRALVVIAILHSLAFSLITLLPHLCSFDDYVLFGGANLSPPLLALFVTLVTLVRRHALPWSHPLSLAVASAVPFWVGNAAIICGVGAGPAAWLRAVVPAAWGWEEMATFHTCGLVGNEMLWAAWRWLAEAEAAAIALAVAQAGAAGGAACGVAPGWFENLLEQSSASGQRSSWRSNQHESGAGGKKET